MRLGMTFVASCAWLFLLQASAWAILIETGPKQRVGGHLVSEDAKKIIVRVKTAEGKERVEVFERSKIRIIHQVDSATLEKLTTDKPKAYRDYAEDLAEHPTDPEAMELALRLYLIAAYLDSAKLGPQCLASMSKLAARPEDARKFRAMAFLLDAKGDQTLLKAEAIKPAPITSPEAKASAKALTDFQKALKLYRSGQVKAAKNSASDKSIADLFGKAGLSDPKRFIQACNDAACTKCKAVGILTCTACNGKGKIPDSMGFGLQVCPGCNGKGKQKCSSCDGTGLNPYPEDYLKAVLRAEIWALDQVLPPDPAAKRSPSGGWSNVRTSQAPIPSLTLETISEFDPRKCVFRNGTWVIP